MVWPCMGLHASDPFQSSNWLGFGRLSVPPLLGYVRGISAENEKPETGCCAPVSGFLECWRGAIFRNL